MVMTIFLGDENPLIFFRGNRKDTYKLKELTNSL